MAKVVKNKVQTEPKILEHSTDVLEIDAEEVFPDEKIEQEISQELVKANITEQVIAQLKEKYLPLKINSQEDKEGYMEVKSARQDCKKLRVLAVKICKKGREWAILEQKKWKSKEDEVCEKIEEIENYLELQEKEYEAERDRIKAELKAKQDKAFAVRSAELNAFGALFNGTDYVLEDVAYEFSAIREADEEIYQTIIKPKYEAVFNLQQAATLAEKQKAEQEAQALREQQEKLAQREKEMAERQAAMDKRQKELDDEAERKAQEQRQAAQKAIDDKVKGRINQLYELGLKFDFSDNHYKGFDVFIPVLDIQFNDDEKWDTELVKVTAHIAKNKQEQADILAKKAEEEKAAAVAKAIEDEKERVRLQAIKDAQAAEQAKILAQQQLDAASDKVKWEVLMTSLAAVVIPEFKSKGYREKASFVKDFLDGLK